MRTFCLAVGRLATLGALGLLVACGSVAQRQSTAPVVVPPIAGIDEPYSLSTHRFELADTTSDMIGELRVTRASNEDTFTDLARRFNVGYEELVRANPGVDPWLPGEGREIVLPTQHLLPNAPREGIVINLAAMRLYYFPRAERGEPQVVYTFPIGIGRVGWATPVGSTTVTRMTRNPTWRPGPGVRAEHAKDGETLPAVVPPGPDNPLGTRALYLGWPSYLIHGTNKPAGVGLRSSHGCIRLFPEDVEFLYELIRPGVKVTVVNQPFVFGWHAGQLYMQAFDVLEDDPRDWKKAQQKLLSRGVAAKIQRDLKARGASIDWQAVSRFSHAPRGLPVTISQADSSYEGLIAEATRVRNAVPIGATWDGMTGSPDQEP
jgi:L,D-transpeptidase ErfK/SrfK